jgi:alpha-glucosidase
MFDLYESWGISGLKLGFMDGYSSYGIKKIYDIIREAAKRKILVNVHDNFRPSGMVRKYPNLLTAEGVRGNEYVTNSGDHTTLLPYTRMLSGATDYTICYKGNDPDYPSKLMDNVTTKGHQLAMSVVNYSPLQHVMWYGRPYIYEKPVETELFSFLPTIWDDSKVQIGEIGVVYSIARKRGNNWFLATINDTREKEISVPLSFLEDGKDYIITTYEDSDSESIEKTEGDLAFFESEGKIINNAMLIKLRGNGGQVAIFKELNDPTINEESGNDPEMTLYPNPADDFVFLELNDSSVTKAEVSLFSMEGKKLFTQDLYSTNGIFRVNVAPIPSGVYFVTVETIGRNFQEVILLK